MDKGKGLNELLKWSIENTNGTPAAPSNEPVAAAPSGRGLSAEALASLLGGPSDAELMRAAMDVVTSRDEETSLENKLTAFDNFEQLIESLDNANLLSKLELWTPLLGVLESEEAELRRMAAWCIGTAVQNNQPSQERLLAVGGIPPLVQLAVKPDEPIPVRRKAVYALSSACRNYQPAMDTFLTTLRAHPAAPSTLPAAVDAMNMDAVDGVIDSLKAGVQEAEAAASAAQST